MEFLVLIYFLALLIFALMLYAVFQLRMAGIKVKDFYSFIQANQLLDKLYVFSRKYEKMKPQEKVIFLSEAEKVFNAFDKIPSEIWEEELRKYSQVLETYKSIRLARWNQQS